MPRPRLLITADGGLRGGRAVPLKVNADKALEKCAHDVKVLMFRHTGLDVPMQEGRDFDAGELMREASDECPPEQMNAEDPLFILYTSGSTGKPKGVLHSSGGYLLYAAMTHEYVFDYKRRATSTGARPMSAGSPATATSSTGRSPTAPPR